LMASLDARFVEQTDRRTELGQYVARLKSDQDEEGEKVVMFPSDFSALVQELFHNKVNGDRAADIDAEKRALKGKGSAQDSQEAQGSDLDPEMQAAMNKIRKLDRILFEKTQDARAVDREVHAEARAPEEERRQKEREARLAKQQERLANQKKRHKQEARVRRALKEVNSGVMPKDVSLQQLRNMVQGPMARFFALDLEDEMLVERVLAEDLDAAANPFDLPQGGPPTPSTAGASERSAATTAESAYSAGEDAARLQEIEARLADFSRQHRWAADGTLEICTSSTPRRAPPCNPSDLASVPASPTHTPAATENGDGVEAVNAEPSKQADLLECTTTGCIEGEGAEGVAGLPTARSESVAESQRSAGSDGSAVRALESAVAKAAGSGDAHLQAQREASAAAAQEEEVDRRLRQLKMAPMPNRLSPQEMASLINECREQQTARDCPPDASVGKAPGRIGSSTSTAPPRDRPSKTQANNSTKLRAESSAGHTDAKKQGFIDRSSSSSRQAYKPHSNTPSPSRSTPANNHLPNGGAQMMSKKQNTAGTNFIWKSSERPSNSKPRTGSAGSSRRESGGRPPRPTSTGSTTKVLAHGMNKPKPVSAGRKPAHIIQERRIGEAEENTRTSI